MKFKQIAKISNTIKPCVTNISMAYIEIGIKN